MNAEIRQLFAEFRTGLVSALGPSLIGAYIYGSVLSEDFAPATSDIDLLVVTRNPLSHEEFDRVAGLHARLAATNPWGGRMQGEYVPQAGVRPEGGIGIGAIVQPGKEVQRGSLEDLTAENLSAIRQVGLALFGPDPKKVLPEVNSSIFTAALRDYLGELVARLEAPGDVTAHDKAEWLLDSSRCLYGLRFAQLSTKSQAATWLMQEYPPLTQALSVALELRAGYIDAPDQDILDDAWGMIMTFIADQPWLTTDLER